jgi:hypothetical protein
LGQRLSHVVHVQTQNARSQGGNDVGSYTLTRQTNIGSQLTTTSGDLNLTGWRGTATTPFAVTSAEPIGIPPSFRDFTACSYAASNANRSISSWFIMPKR